MSGIAGIIHFDGRPVEPGLIEGMTGAMAHRGPDAIDHWRRGPVALGHCMLRTTPESLEEQQPLVNEDESLVLVMDGRVDNWEELRRELLAHGAALRSHADAELVLRSYEIWGRDCLQHIDGDFALVVWDDRRKEAFCARDRVGNKPFHHHWDGRTFSFASELHAILALPWVPEELNEGMVAEFLGYEWISRGETFWKGVMRLVAGHQLIVTPQGDTCQCYWTPDLHRELGHSSLEEAAEHYRALLRDLTRRMSRSIGPIACEVSGGLDSSAIFALAELLRRDGALLASRLDGYTLAFEDGTEADEIEYARAVGEHLGVSIAEVEPSYRPLAWYRARARRYRIFPSYPNGVMGLDIRRLARERGSKALLVGIGGDEWLCGSRNYYQEALFSRDIRSLAESWRADVQDLGIGRSLYLLAQQGLMPLLPEAVRQWLRRIRAHRSGRGNPPWTWLAPAMQELLKERRRYADPLPVATPPAGQEAVLRTLHDAFGVAARELEDGLAASEGIELRRPLYAPAMVEWALATPERFKLRGTTDKYVHRLAMSGILPDRVLARADKADFMVTFRRNLSELHSPDWAGLVGQVNWVLREEADRLCDRIGDPRYGGVPEWQLWTLLGCHALTSARVDEG